MRLEGIIYTYDEGKILRYGQHLTTINYGNKGIVVEAQIAKLDELEAEGSPFSPKLNGNFHC